MDNNMPSDDLGHMRCSDLDVPLFTLENFVLGVLPFLNDITYERRKLLANGRINSETVLLLSDMCEQMLEAITNRILEEVVPQVQSMMHIQIEQGRNYFTVTEEDIQASIGDSFHICFGVALGVEQERSCYSETLMELFAAEVMKRVNQKLDTITRSSSSPQSTDSAESQTSNASHTKDMVYNISRILSECLGRIYQLESPEDQETLESEFSEAYGPDVECNGDLKAEEAETTNSLPENADVSHSEMVESSVIPAEEDQESLDSEFSEGSRPDVDFQITKEKCKNARKMPSDDLGHMRCSDLDVPLLTLEDFVFGVLSFLNNITYERRKLLAYGHIDSETILLLSDMCKQMLEAITKRILEDVIPQVQSKMHIQIAQGRNYFTVTEEDIQASIGDSFHTCFGVALGVEQERSCYSETLMELFTAEVTKRVNQKLDTITRSSSSPQSTDSAELQTSNASHTKDMVYNISHVLSECLGRIYQLESPEDQETLESEFSKGYGPDEECNEDLKAEESEATNSLPENADVAQSEIVESSVIPAEEDQETLDSEFSEGFGPDEEGNEDLKAEESEATDSLPENADVAQSEIVESSVIPAEEDQETLDSEFSEGFGPDEEGNEDLKAEESEATDSLPENADVAQSEIVESSVIPAEEDQETLDSEFSEGFGPDEEGNEDLKAEESEATNSLPENADVAQSEIVESSVIPAEEDQETLDSEFSEGFGPDEEGNEDLKAEESEATNSLPENADVAQSEIVESSVIPAEEDQENLHSEFSKGYSPDEECNGDLKAEEYETTNALPENGDVSHSKIVESAVIPKECLDSESSESSSPDEEYNQLKEEDALSESPDLSDFDTTESSSSSSEDLEQQDWEFLAKFLCKLLDRIAWAPSPIMFKEEVQFDDIIVYLRQCTMGVTLPKTVGDIYIPIHEELCRQFGSAKVLRDVMVSGDMAFKEAVARTLKAQLVSDDKAFKEAAARKLKAQQLSGEKNRQQISFRTKLKRFFCRTSSPSVDVEQRKRVIFGIEFLDDFLYNLVDHIAYSTKASMFEMQFDDIIVYLRQCTMGVTLPQTAGDIHIPIYEELCRQFGSAKVLRDVMVSGDVAFEEAVARTLKAQLQKPSGENISFRTKLKRFICKKSRAVAPQPMIAPEETITKTSEEPTCVSFLTKLKKIFCRKRRDVGQEPMNTSVSYTEVIELVNGMTPPPQRTQKLPAIHRKMSSMARILRRPFTCCICAAQDD